MASEEIDDTLYSRQRYVLGDSAMKRMAQSSVLLHGMGGLGVEIAKNIVLAGIKCLTIQDSLTATVEDLGTQFFIREDDVKNNRNRAEVSSKCLMELNPYVSVKTITEPLNLQTDLSYLNNYQCVILTSCSLLLQLKVNDFCRNQTPPIQFIMSDVFGVFGQVFCDFGDEFEVMDTNGEEPKEVFIAKISKASPGVVTCLDNKVHGFETNDVVTFKEVKGMESLNGTQHTIKVLTPYTFSICDTNIDEYGEYQGGGIASQIKVSKIVNFECLEQQLQAPSLLFPDFSKFQAPSVTHLGFLTLHSFMQKQNRLPEVWCPEDGDLFLSLAKDLNKEIESVDEKLLQYLCYTNQGCLAPICATIGGFVAQEALKALTGKFTPLVQWLYLDATELIPEQQSTDQFKKRGDRYDSLRICVGEDKVEQLANTRLFMVGCGAIGCEMLKNYALMGISRGHRGQITITDNDLIEKSNLNRQFLFRPKHIRMPKSITAALSVLEINPELKIEAQQHKVCPQTEESVYNDGFFEQQDVIVNALDNVEARRYMDGRCVINQKPLLESGTMGTKGHVQVIVPHLTESYSSQRDPPDEDYPYCTVKSFPATIEHCIQWARDKFEQAFVQKPQLYNKFWSTNGDINNILERLKREEMLEGSVKVSKSAASRPTTWSDCVRLARLKFEKYFNHKAKQLLHSFPLDTTLSDGSPFWQSPKRPPAPIEFNPNNDLHMLYIQSCSRLYADISHVTWTPQDLEYNCIRNILVTIPVPEFIPSNKKIETDEAASKESNTTSYGGDEEQETIHRFLNIVQNTSKIPVSVIVSNQSPVEFEKDDDNNGHIDFISTSANLRAEMYSIENADRLKIKRIAGRIVPAIATTTAAVSGLVSIELIKILDKSRPIEHYKNCFLNLGLPLMLLSEPGPTERTVIREGLSYTMWDRWEVTGNKDFTLQQFLDYFKTTYGLEPSMVVHGVKMVFVPIMPGHMKRKPHTMLKLLKPTASIKYMDLVLSFDNESGNDEDEDIAGPPVRYYFGL
ncbi:ubiquitin-like modifier-activating enzyme 6 [Patella vulgata]|uniref:ubiquitin-like modifier-activating enzyme 6 n=1 Tax=Patella vulgata TaxID=6465 RepID=UPI0021807DE5|nr:ubiquitin-like modifier-activating enzyme 6 [Patella vulgata]